MESSALIPIARELWFRVEKGIQFGPSGQGIVVAAPFAFDGFGVHSLFSAVWG